MILTDTHTHLYSQEFDADREKVVNDAVSKGVERFFIPAIDSRYTQAMTNLQQAYPDHVYLMMGLHPTSVGENYQEELDHVAAMLETGKYYGIGETGIDLYWDRSYLEQQRAAFRFQIELARKYQLPVIIHCREAFDEIFDILKESSGVKGIFHCFTGTLEQARQAISCGMALGIGGVVTYKNGKIDTFLSQIALEHIVLETDAPYLAPVPHRGKRNESGYLIHILKKLSGIYSLPEEKIAAVTTENSIRIFGI